MSFALPTTPKARHHTWEYVTKAVDTDPPLGGASQRLSRLGDRFAITIHLMTMDYECAMAWLADRVKATVETVTYPVPQRGFDPTSPGTILVNGASQAGTTLNADGVTPGYVFRKGRFFSFTMNGRIYLHMMSAEATANGSGQVALPIMPMLRVSPSDNLALNFTAPRIEGFIEGTVAQWEAEFDWARGGSFTIKEAE